MTSKNIAQYNPIPFPKLKKRLWIGTFLVQAILLICVAIFRPEDLKVVFMSILLGCFYLWSLIFNAEYPKKSWQWSFSIIRMGLIAWLIVQLTDARMTQLALVIVGLLSYKLVLMVEYVIQALPVIKIKGFIKQ
jgi:hypothetical protein